MIEEPTRLRFRFRARPPADAFGRHVATAYTPVEVTAPAELVRDVELPHRHYAELPFEIAGTADRFEGSLALAWGSTVERDVPELLERYGDAP